MTGKKLDAGAPRVLPPPPPSDNAKRALNKYGAVRGEDGRVMRSTGRDVQFATIVTPELKDWIKTEAKRRGCCSRICATPTRRSTAARDRSPTPIGCV
jgi:hypothetical protein